MPLQKRNIELEVETTTKQLTHMAVDNSISLQRFIEAQLIAMGERGIPYTDLWEMYEELGRELAMLSK